MSDTVDDDELVRDLLRLTARVWLARHGRPASFSARDTGPWLIAAENALWAEAGEP